MKPKKKNPYETQKKKTIKPQKKKKTVFFFFFNPGFFPTLLTACMMSQVHNIAKKWLATFSNN